MTLYVVAFDHHGCIQQARVRLAQRNATGGARTLQRGGHLIAPRGELVRRHEPAPARHSVYKVLQDLPRPAARGARQRLHRDAVLPRGEARVDLQAARVITRQHPRLCSLALQQGASGTTQRMQQARRAHAANAGPRIRYVVEARLLLQRHDHALPRARIQRVKLVGRNHQQPPLFQNGAREVELTAREHVRPLARRRREARRRRRRVDHQQRRVRKVHLGLTLRWMARTAPSFLGDTRRVTHGLLHHFKERLDAYCTRVHSVLDQRASAPAAR